MILKNLFECIKCFMIGDDRDTKNDIERILYPEEQTRIESEHRLDYQTSSLYIPPTDATEDKSGNKCICEANSSDKRNNGVEDINSSMISNPAHRGISEEKDKNTASSTLVYQLAELIEKLDMTKNRLVNEETISMISFCQSRIIECIANNGYDLINSDIIYSNERHIPTPYKIIPNGVVIKRILRPGIMFDKKVVLKAIVELCEE